ncbi:TonB-dependent receptor [Proteiniphilum sp. X52]|nr:TonB-dependent receptor [Proteiniphilum sp. X52]
MHAFGQSHTVTGKIVDEQGEEAIGATVVIKGTSTGVVTNIDGIYQINVPNPSTDILVFSYIGMETQEIAVNGQKVMNVTFKSSSVMLDEVVSIGYGTTRRGDLTGSVTSVRSTELAKVPTADVTQSLAGRMAGVQVLQNEGAPGASISIRVRGGISITQSNEPLYIIDGFPDEDGLATLDPSEIESIDILKDASATAIYGARGANGVVLITTKSGLRDGQKLTVTFDSYVGVKKVANKLPVLSTEEFVLLDYERRYGGNRDTGIENFERLYGPFNDIHANYGNRPGIDWQKETLGRTAYTQNYRVGLNGGTKDLQYNLSYLYFKDQGAMVYSGNDKNNILFNINHKPNEKFSISGRINYDQIKTYGMGTSENGDRFNKMQHILQYRPTTGITGTDDLLLGDEDPLLVDDSGNVMQNPLISAKEETNNKEYRTIQASESFTYKFTKNWSFRNSSGIRYQTRRDEIFFGDRSITAKRSSINGSITNRETGSAQASNVLNYSTRSKGNRYEVMVGQEYVQRWNRYFRASASNFPNDDIGLNDLSLGATPGIPQSYADYDDKLLSFFSRFNFNHKDKYLLTASMRMDGSSKFGDKKKWGYFPAVSGAWRLSEEEFIKNLNLFSDLKLRLGYGMAGNNRIPSYGSLPILGSVTYPQGSTTTPGYASTQIPNPYLMWESNKTFNAGFDIGLLDQRITITPEFYINRSSNLLLNSRLPKSSGYANMMRNIGETENKGVDLTINTVNIDKKDFSWTTNFNISHNKNSIKALSGEDFFLEEANFGYNLKTHLIQVGEPLGLFYGYITDGVYGVDDFNYDATAGTYTLKEGIAYHGNRDQIVPGMWKFRNVDDSNEIIDEDDKTIIGKANPVFHGGLNNTFTYKNFDLSVFFTFNYGNDILNATKLTNSLAGRTNKNVLDVVNSANRWMTINHAGEIVTDPAELAALNSGKKIAAYHDLEEGDKYIHSWAIEDGSFIRLSNVSMGYSFPKQITDKLSVRNLRLYVTGNNLFVWTKYSGYDPEVSTRGNGLTPGVDFGAYPRSRTIVFGINLTL